MLSSKVALITGAAQGIGLATATLLLSNGAKVSMLDISEKVGREACANLQKKYSTDHVQFLPTDVTKSEELRAAFARTKELFGSIDVVMNNAGIGDENDWRKTLSINLVAVMEGTYLGLEYMSIQKGGRGGTIINVGSFGGLVPMPYSPAYCASKHGVVGFSRSMTSQAEFDSVRVNCVCPEFVRTRMVVESEELMNTGLVQGLGLVEPESVAEGVLELITDTSQVGKVMTITNGKGRRYIRLLGDPKLQRSKM